MAKAGGMKNGPSTTGNPSGPGRSNNAPKLGGNYGKASGNSAMGAKGRSGKK